MVNTFAAGGTADVLTRLVADQLSATFKQQFFVETRAGAAGTIGVKSVADSAPDGYNFALTNITHLVLAPISNPKLGYDPKRDLTNIGYVAGSPIVLSVSANGSIKTLKDFIEQGRAGKALTYSSSGVGSSGQLVAEDFAKKAGIKIEHVPYKGASQGLTDLAGGHIVFAALVRGGQLRAIAHSNATRMPDFPEVPTLKESGYDVVATTWFSISGPANLPKDITEKVNREIARAVSNPDAQARLQRDGMIAHIMSVDELSKYIDAETTRWRPVLDQLGLIGK
jgi:tripartite-type tricarboxylate transporter receptor subunit TctC